MDLLVLKILSRRAGRTQRIGQRYKLSERQHGRRMSLPQDSLSMTCSAEGQAKMPKMNFF
jgi:hypothetical protein